MTIISRKAAKAAGEKYYFTGKPCKRGHIDRRFVASFWCLTCGREKARDAYRSLDTAQRRAIRLKQKTNFARWIDANREHWLESQKVRNAKQKQETPDYFKQHYAANKERRKQESLAWYRENTEYAAQRQKAYDAKRLAEQPEHVRAIGRRHASTRRAIKKLVFVEDVDPRVVFERDKGVCGICLELVDPSSPWEIDHIIPISKGGPHSYANVQLSHRRCNRSKSARLPVAVPDGQEEREGRDSLA